MAKTKTKATAKKSAAAARPASKPKASASAAKGGAKRAPAVVAKGKATTAKAKAKGKPAAAKPAPKLVSVKSSPAKPVIMKSAVKATPAKPTPKVIKVGDAAPDAKIVRKPGDAAPDAKIMRKPGDAKPANGKVKPAPQIIPPPQPMRLGGKPGKNQAGLTTKELEVFRDELLRKRRELLGDMRSMESEALQRSGENLSNLPLHMADMGTDNYEQEFTLGLMEKDRQLLREINAALSKIMDGRYGICEGTGKVISKARLEVQPWARYSIEHARKLENRGVR